MIGGAKRSRKDWRYVVVNRYVVANGVKDNWERITSALNKLQWGGTEELPAGLIAVSKPIQIPAGRWLAGVSGPVRQFVPEGFGTFIVPTEDFVGDSLIEYAGQYSGSRFLNADAKTIAPSAAKVSAADVTILSCGFNNGTAATFTSKGAGATDPASSNRLELTQSWVTNQNAGNASYPNAANLLAAGADWNCTSNRFKKGKKTLYVSNGMWGVCHFTGTAQNVIFANSQDLGTGGQIMSACTFDSSTGALLTHATGAEQVCITASTFLQKSGVATGPLLLEQANGNSVGITGSKIVAGGGMSWTNLCKGPNANTIIADNQCKSGAFSVGLFDSGTPGVWRTFIQGGVDQANG